MLQVPTSRTHLRLDFEEVEVRIHHIALRLLLDIVVEIGRVFTVCYQMLICCHPGLLALLYLFADDR